MYIPEELVAIICAYREPHPICRLIYDLQDKADELAYDNLGGSYPETEDDEEGELTMSEVRAQPLYRNLKDASLLKCVNNWGKEWYARDFLAERAKYSKKPIKYDVSEWL
jgi:hypothetical protein